MKADSPIVEAVRGAREKIAKESGYNLPKVLEALRRDEQASGRPTRSPRETKAKPR